MKREVKRILFVCKHNRFRSKVAEALFKKYNKNKKIKIDSCGTNLDYIPVARNVIIILKIFGVKRVNRYPKKISKKLINKSDLVVIVANNINKNIFKKYEKKIIVWKIFDTSQDNYNGILKRTKLIEKRIKRLIKGLK